MRISPWRSACQTFCLVILLATASIAQSSQARALSVPFTIDRHRVIIPASVNGSKPLRLILDTGLRFDGVYLFHRDAVNLIDTAGAVQVQVGGAGDGAPSTATMIQTGRLSFGDVEIRNQSIIISHSEHTQSFPTDGIIGWNLFGHYIVEIDYDRQVILLHDTVEVISDSGWQVISVEMKKDLPFLQVTVEVTAGEPVPMVVYIDLASEEALELLVRDDQKFRTPDSLTSQLLGVGLSGEIYGEYGRVGHVNFGGYDLHHVRTAFAPAKTRSKQEGADGIFGNDMIRRFNVIFDYPHTRLYIKPNKSFADPFEAPAP
ncbi:MAG: aspartyl protease family protein [bacterium]|nr:aspartyl protease family protein [bacterium]